jgi:hypothetical protein
MGTFSEYVKHILILGFFYICNIWTCKLQNTLLFSSENTLQFNIVSQHMHSTLVDNLLAIYTYTK